MAEFRYGVTGKERRAFANAVSEILGNEVEYLGIRGEYAYRVGDFTIDRNGTLHGDDNIGLLTGLIARGYIQADTTLDGLRGAEGEAAPEENAEQEAESQEMPVAVEAESIEIPSELDATDELCIEVPLDGFTPEKLDNLQKLVDSKAVLIKQVLGTDYLPIKIVDNSRIAFPWFKATDSDSIKAYSQFISALTETAKKKNRVLAKSSDNFDNPRFTMRVWLIGLGLVGREFDLCRKLMMKGLPGNSGFRYGKPNGETLPRQRSGVHREVISIRLTSDTLEKLNILATQAEAETGQRTSRNQLIELAIEAFVADAIAEGAVAETASSPDNALICAGEVPADDTSDEVPIEAEGANVAEINGDEGEMDGDK